MASHGFSPGDRSDAVTLLFVLKAHKDFGTPPPYLRNVLEGQAPGGLAEIPLHRRKDLFVETHTVSQQGVDRAQQLSR